MNKPSDIRIVDISTNLENILYRTPMKFGGRVVTDVTLFNVDVTVETRQGQQGTGHGSMPVGNAWGWPSTRETGDRTLEAMIQLGNLVAQAAGKLDAQGHPIELVHDLSHDYQNLSNSVADSMRLAEGIPRLAQLVAASPIDAAINDAYGDALQANSYDLLSEDFMNRDLGHFLDGKLSGRFLDEFTLRTPKPTMPLYHLIGALDPLTDDDIAERLNDGVPETLGEWILADGLTHMKIKLNGDDLDWDVARVAAIESVNLETQSKRGCAQWWYSTDFNEKCADVDYVLDFLRRIQEVSPTAFDRIQYIEQPTHRDLKSNPENKMHEAATIKPVVIDESLVDLESLELSREQGDSGVALKACKGHGEALLMGALAQHYNLFLCVQDLTCVGASFLHSASIAARIGSVAAIEGNGRQYCPRGNEGWDAQFPDMFQISDGTVGTALLNKNGLGYRI